METDTPPELARLDNLGADTVLQAEFLEVIEEISSNVSVALQHADEWVSAVGFVTVEPTLFVRELKEAYPVYSVLDDSLKVSFISRNDGKYWQFTLSKTAFLHIRQDPQSFPSA